MKKAVYSLIVVVLMTTLLVVLTPFIVSTTPKQYRDTGYVYQKQILIETKYGIESRTYLLGLQDPENPQDKGIREVDSYTYQFYPLCSYYPYNLWEEN